MATSGEQPDLLGALDARLEQDAAYRREILDLAKRLERRGFRFGKMPATAKIMLKREHLDTVSADDLVQARDELRAFYAVIMRREQGVVGRIQELKRTRIAAVVVALLAGAGAAYGVQQLQSGNSGEVIVQDSEAIPKTTHAPEPPAVPPPPSLSPPVTRAPTGPPPVRKLPQPAVKKRAAVRHHPAPSPSAPERPRGGDGTIRTLTDANFEKETAHGFWVVDFWAPWCGPCRALAPIFDEVAGKYGRTVQFARIKVNNLYQDEWCPTAHRLAVRGLPTVLFLRDGKVVDKLDGLRDARDYEAILEVFGY